MFKSLKNWWIRRELVNQLQNSVFAIIAKNVPAYLESQMFFWDALAYYKGDDRLSFF